MSMPFPTLANGNFYNGKWRNGIKHGEGVYVFRDKKLSMTGVWVNGVPKISIMEHYTCKELLENDDDQIITKITIPEVRY